MYVVLLVLAALTVGAGSALVPLLSAEAYVAAAVASRPELAVPIVAALAAGQTAGKLALFELARRGAHRPRLSRRLDALTSNRWATRIQRGLRTPRTALPTVLFSAGVGLPPLAVVSVTAGAAGQSRSGFLCMCLIGRALRFGALAAPIALASAHR